MSDIVFNLSQSDIRKEISFLTHHLRSGDPSKKALMEVAKAYKKGDLFKTHKSIINLSTLNPYVVKDFYNMVHGKSVYFSSDSLFVNSKGEKCNRIGMSMEDILHFTKEMYFILSEIDMEFFESGKTFIMSSPYPIQFMFSMCWWLDWDSRRELMQSFEKAYSWFDFNLDFNRHRISELEYDMLSVGNIHPSLIRVGNDLTMNRVHRVDGNLTIRSLDRNYYFNENVIINI